MKIAIVTGASSGMGREFVLQLPQYAEVDEIWAIARRQQALETLASESGVPVRPVLLDLCKEESFSALAAMLEKEQPDVRLLVNAAGFGKFGAYHKVSLEEECRMIDLNCKALVAVTRIVLPFMHRGSHVLQLARNSSWQPVPYITTYGATKAMVLSYSRALNRELKSRGIAVTAVCPFWTKTPFFDRAIDPDREPVVKQYDVMYDPGDVVALAWRDAKRGRDMSKYGAVARFQGALAKLLPHSFVMSYWMKQQKLK